MLHGFCFGEEAGARNLGFFPCKVVAAGDERYLVCAAVVAAVVTLMVVSRFFSILALIIFLLKSF